MMMKSPTAGDEPAPPPLPGLFVSTGSQYADQTQPPIGSD